MLYACVKVLLPMACVLLLGAALWQLLVGEQPAVPWLPFRSGQPLAGAGLQARGISANGFGRRRGGPGQQLVLALVGAGGVAAGRSSGSFYAVGYRRNHQAAADRPGADVTRTGTGGHGRDDERPVTAILLAIRSEQRQSRRSASSARCCSTSSP